MTSLSELRAIHQQRVVDERTAFERERAAEIEAKRAAEQAAIDAVADKHRQEREAAVRIEQARADAEREARLKVEAAEAAERARLQIALEAQRHHDEMELRRAEVAKQRPKWMMAVTAVALVAGIGLTYLAVQRGHEADVATEQAKLAKQRRDNALAQVEESRAQLDRVQRDLDALDVKIQAATDAALKASNAAEAEHARQLAAAAAQQRIDTKRALDAAQAKHDAAVRDAGIDYSGCAGTALGCIDAPKPHKK